MWKLFFRIISFLSSRRSYHHAGVLLVHVIHEVAFVTLVVTFLPKQKSPSLDLSRHRYVERLLILDERFLCMSSFIVCVRSAERGWLMECALSMVRAGSVARAATQHSSCCICSLRSPETRWTLWVLYLLVVSTWFCFAAELLFKVV